MKKKVFGLMAAGMMLAASAMAQETPQAAEPAYNVDYQPSSEVGPGMYGKMSSPVQSKFNLSIGGFIKLDYAHNSVNFGKAGSLSPGSGAIAKKGSTYDRQEQSIFTARQSRIWLKVGGPGFLGAKTGALIEVDFYGDASAANESPQVRMRHAYATIDWPKTQLLFGQTWDIFGPMAANTQDFRQRCIRGMLFIEMVKGKAGLPFVPQRVIQGLFLATTAALQGHGKERQDDRAKTQALGLMHGHHLHRVGTDHIDIKLFPFHCLITRQEGRHVRKFILMGLDQVQKMHQEPLVIRKMLQDLHAAVKTGNCLVNRIKAGLREEILDEPFPRQRKSTLECRIKMFTLCPAPGHNGIPQAVRRDPAGSSKHLALDERAESRVIHRRNHEFQESHDFPDEGMLLDVQGALG